MAKDKVTDKKVLLQFYQESASVLTQEGKRNQALDSCKKALELARQLFREDDYTLYECQISLAEAYENAGYAEEAKKTFDDCFQALDGRDGQASGRMSLTSTLSRALSIKSRTTSLVSYTSKKTVAGGKAGNSDAMQRVAVTLRQK